MAENGEHPSSLPPSMTTNELINPEMEEDEEFHESLQCDEGPSARTAPSQTQPPHFLPYSQHPALPALPPQSSQHSTTAQTTAEMQELKTAMRELTDVVGYMARHTHPVSSTTNTTGHHFPSSTPHSLPAFSATRPHALDSQIRQQLSQSQPAHHNESRKTKYPRDFEGKDETWEDYLCYFIGVAKWNCWGEDDKCRGLYIALKGAAADLVYNVPNADNFSFQELCDLLESRFGAERRLTADKKALKQRVKQKGETYHALGDDVIRLARRVYKCSPALADREGTDAYIQALPQNLRLPVASANPSTVRECVELVERLCTVIDQNELDVEARRVRRVNTSNNNTNNNNASNHSISNSNFGSSQSPSNNGNKGSNNSNGSALSSNSSGYYNQNHYNTSGNPNL
jgi:hypothetical protein